MQFVVIAGGLGTRSKLSVPKVLNEIGGESLLKRMLDQFSFSQPGQDKSVLFLLGHESEIIDSYVNQISENYDFTISIFKESKRIGTAGALVQARESLEEECIIVLGDLFLDFDFDNFLAFAKVRDSDFSLVCHPNGHSYDSDLVELSAEDSQILGIDLKRNRTSAPQGSIAAAGIYYMRGFKNYLNEIEDTDEAIDILDDLVVPHLGEMNRPIGYVTLEYIKDAGTPDRITQIERDLTNGIVKRRSRRTRKPVIFIDKDDTLILDCESGKPKFAIGVTEQIHQTNNLGIPIILITNQPKVAKGESTLQEVERELSDLNLRLGTGEAFLDAWYWCPHHPETGHSDEVRIYKVKCHCRKPNTGLFEYAERDHKLDLNRSWMIGDQETDLLAANALNMNFAHTIEFVQYCKIETNHFCFNKTSDAIKQARKQLC